MAEIDYEGTDNPEAILVDDMGIIRTLEAQLSKVNIINDGELWITAYISGMECEISIKGKDVLMQIIRAINNP
ncbi:hypothetical protein [Nocardia jiangxiensis]|uniref:hypothetical protein n=1 Tax=Nocardia jiangxiensis TaxID=282685 RepID=UPI000300C661|nr:hypothetical protein [Nocardia jiangxiensis]